MGLYSLSQVLGSDARRPNNSAAYVAGGVVKAPTYALSNSNKTITYSAGKIEFEGTQFNITNALNLDTAGSGNIGALLGATAATYVIAAVPKYADEVTYANQAAAEAAGANYYFQNVNGEGIAYTFIDSNITAGVAAVGGEIALEQAVLGGSATSSQIALFNRLGEAKRRSQDPRYAVFPLVPTGVDVVLFQVSAQQNYPSNATETNGLINLTQTEFNLRNAQVPYFYQETKILTPAAADTRYNGKGWLFSKVKGYTSLANAQSDTSGTVVNGLDGTTSEFATAAAVPATDYTHFVVVEYTYPVHIAVGQRGNYPKIVSTFTRESSGSALLGRIKPIYLNRPNLSVALPQAYPASPLTRHADPVPLTQVTITSAGVITVDKEINEGFYI